MYLQEEDYKKRIAQHKRTNQNLREKVRTLFQKLRQNQVEVLTDDEVKRYIEHLVNGNNKKEEKIAKLEELIVTLYAQIEETKNSRNAVVEAVTSDLEEELIEANKKIQLLAQAVTDPGKADSVFLQRCKVHTIETDDDRRWMSNAMKQLEKAVMKLLTVEERLDAFAHNLEAANASKTEYTEKTMKPLGKAIVKINSVVSHIECFFDKIGDIEIAEDE